MSREVLESVDKLVELGFSSPGAMLEGACQNGAEELWGVARIARAVELLFELERGRGRSP